MKRNVVLEEFHVTVLVSRTLDAKETGAIRRVLGNQQFRIALGRTIRTHFRRHSALQNMRIEISF
jgi:hypothetical protein